jgi:predicted PhzF superfamily epimerase YddE/YHI9
VDFPAIAAGPLDLPDGVVDAIGFEPVDWAFAEPLKMLLVEVNEAAELRGCQPDFAAIAKMPYLGILVTAPGEDSDYDFISRFFAPGAGINEDPVTGAAHCVLGPYWETKLGRARFLAYQASARGGEVRVEVNGGRVTLGGKAVTVMRGELI